MDKRQSTYLK